MQNYCCVERNPKIELLSAQLGFDTTVYLTNHFIILSSSNTKELLAQVQDAKKRKLTVLYRTQDEKMLRFAIEKAPVDMILGVENIFPKDSLHYLKSGLNQVLCTIAAQQNKIIVFSMHDILVTGNRAKLLARMRFNVKLCKKYKVQTLIGNFSEDIWEMRAAEELKALGRLLGV